MYKVYCLTTKNKTDKVALKNIIVLIFSLVNKRLISYKSPKSVTQIKYFTSKKPIYC